MLSPDANAEKLETIAHETENALYLELVANKFEQRAALLLAMKDAHQDALVSYTHELPFAFQYSTLRFMAALLELISPGLSS